MSDMAMIAGAVSSLKAASDMAKALIGIRDATILNQKVIELQGVILSAQSGALAAQSDQFSLLERIRDLEAQVARIEDWNTQSEKYELKQIAGGAFAFMLKPEHRGSEPPHWLCTTCYERRQKSFLQKQAEMGGKSIYRCVTCTSTMHLLWGAEPKWQ